MQYLISTLNILLTQTEEQKRLTVLYVGLFVLVCLLLVIDTRDGKKLVGGNKLLKKIFVAMLFIAIVVWAILYFVL